MKAVLQDRYGPPEVLRIGEVEKPEPKDGEVLIRVMASTVTQTDAHLRAPDPFVWRLLRGIRRPNRWPTLGVELAGILEGVGAGVTEFKVGDAVFGQPPWVGAHAEYICVRETAAIARMPTGLSFEEAASVADGVTQALATLRQAGVAAGQHIVVYGASGSLGTAAVQLAKEIGAHVTGVTSTKHVELVRSLGADEVVDYLHDDYTKGGRTYDAIIDAVGKGSFLRGRRALKPGGTFVATDGMRNFLWWLLTWKVASRRLKFAAGQRRKKDVLFLKDLIEAGKFRPVIDRRYPMDQVADAHRYVDSWHKGGNVVLVIADEGTISA